jgi:pterin-4a-carbinolamine dehydratase
MEHLLIIITFLAFADVVSSKAKINQGDNTLNGDVENQTLNWYFRSDDFGISRYDFSNYEQVMKFFNRAKEKMEQLGVK